MKNEYELLREEILDIEKTRVQYNTVLYSVVSVILVFVLGETEYYLCLIPFIAIVPLYIARETKGRYLCQMGAYLYVFHEGNEYNWEIRHLELQRSVKMENQKQRKHGSIASYYVLTLTCSGFSIYKLICMDYSCKGKIARIVGVIVFTFVMIIVMKKSTVDFVMERDTWIEKWKKIRDGGSNYAVSE